MKYPDWFQRIIDNTNPITEVGLEISVQKIYYNGDEIKVNDKILNGILINEINFENEFSQNNIIDIITFKEDQLGKVYELVDINSELNINHITYLKLIKK